MLIAGIAIAAFVLVGSFAVWSRLASHGAERRSVTTHQHALDVLGTASRRWEGVAPVHLPKADEVARAHVQPMGAPSARRGDDTPVPGHRPAVRLVPPSGSTPAKLPIFVDESVARRRPLDGLAPGEAGADFAERARDEMPGRKGATLFDNEAPEPAGATTRTLSRRRHRYRGGRPARRAASTAAAAVAIAAIGVASWQLASGGTPGRQVKATTSRTKGKTHTGTKGHSQRLVPTSVSSSIVAYLTTSRTYTIDFSASGPCWLGVQQGVNGRYLWMTTMAAGEKTSYKASGPIAVRLGAPVYIKVQVDSVYVELPATNVQPYDITFSPSPKPQDRSTKP